MSASPRLASSYFPKTWPRFVSGSGSLVGQVSRNDIDRVEEEHRRHNVCMQRFSIDRESVELQRL